MTNTFHELRTQGDKRQGVYSDKDWSLPEWACAAAGEMGELCNVIKKIHRGDFDLQQGRQDVADEAADVVIYLDRLCKAAGINLESAVINKFNRSSIKIGCPDILIDQTSYCECGSPVPDSTDVDSCGNCGYVIP